MKIPTSSTPIQSTPLVQDEIARLAYELWLQEGCPTDRDRAHWAEAERQVLSLTQTLPPSDLPDSTPLKHGARLDDVDSPHMAFAEEAPLATRVEKELSKSSIKSRRRNSGSASVD